MVRLLTGNALDMLKTLPDESVHCCTTSPPYWGLRQYSTQPQIWRNGGEPCQDGSHEWGEAGGGLLHENRNNLKGSQEECAGQTGTAHIMKFDRIHTQNCLKCGSWRGELGSEPTPEMFVDHLVQIFREVRRVLRPDACLFVNIGDSYASGKSRYSTKEQSILGGGEVPEKYGQLHNGGKPDLYYHPVLKDKDLCMIPHRLAIALQADGWWVRQDIIWHKPNPMPESVTDRFTKSHEYVFLLTKSARYFFDSYAVREKAAGVSGGKSIKINHNESQGKHGDTSTFNNGHSGCIYRNRRSVWSINTKPLKEAHFAAFPPELPEICIKAGTSEKGCCDKCGSPYERVVEKQGGSIGKGGWHSHSDDTGKGMMQYDGADKDDSDYQVKSSGWQQTCTCNTGTVIPCTVLDPFSGAGTTGVSAVKLGRSYIGIELNPDYVKMSEKRIANSADPLFCNFEELKN